MATKTTKAPKAEPALTEKMILILADMQAHEGAWFASEIAERLGTTPKSINPVLTSLCGENRGYLAKEDAQEEVIDTKTGKPKLVTHKRYWLTEKGLRIDLSELN